MDYVTNRTGRRKPYIEGTKVQLTEAWKRAVDAKLGELQQTRKWLADQLGVDKSNVTKLLGPDQNSSSLVPAICEILELPMPQRETRDPMAESTLDDLLELNPEDIEQVRALIRRLRRDRK